MDCPVNLDKQGSAKIREHRMRTRDINLKKDHEYEKYNHRGAHPDKMIWLAKALMTPKLYLIKLYIIQVLWKINFGLSCFPVCLCTVFVWTRHVIGTNGTHRGTRSHLRHLH